tara:strand:+ start:22 stop:342 length:321 start_codon:yes stop_codon:yes gene_type:complete
MTTYTNLTQFDEFNEDLANFQAEQDKQTNLARMEDIQQQGELFPKGTKLKPRSEELETILEVTDNGDMSEIIESEIEMILFNINNTDSEYELARLYKDLNNRLSMT